MTHQRHGKNIFNLVVAHIFINFKLHDFVCMYKDRNDIPVNEITSEVLHIGISEIYSQVVQAMPSALSTINSVCGIMVIVYF